MLSILGSILSGGATGLLGIGIQRFFDHKAKKLELELNNQKFAHEINLRKVDAEIMAQEWAGRFKVAEVEGDAKAFDTALTSEPKRYYEGTDLTPKQKWLMVGLDFIRGIVRPGLTLYLCAITTIVYFQAAEVMGNSILPFQAYDLVDKIVQTVLYLTTTCVLFWFGARNKGKQP